MVVTQMTLAFAVKVTLTATLRAARRPVMTKSLCLAASLSTEARCLASLNDQAPKLIGRASRGDAVA